MGTDLASLGWGVGHPVVKKRWMDTGMSRKATESLWAGPAHPSRL